MPPVIFWFRRDLRLADNIALDRPESLANANYPLGLPVLLRLIAPIFGSLLTGVDHLF